ncbi:hypothetical protein BCR43DRAFT_483986 [Syncephalastrum racemosum]|uniref:Uncharacterized protein n=1 Tax=Syncephalastrum racemosum TaxID=13706 RepID=A0A1X2HW13_SYNRA|nr:hypothetical protein BCR43DRAFT_483986 [Syncephalastrum racemosum]
MMEPANITRNHSSRNLHDNKSNSNRLNQQPFFLSLWLTTIWPRVIIVKSHDPHPGNPGAHHLRLYTIGMIQNGLCRLKTIIYPFPVSKRMSRIIPNRITAAIQCRAGEGLAAAILRSNAFICVILALHYVCSHLLFSFSM